MNKVVSDSGDENFENGEMGMRGEPLLNLQISIFAQINLRNSSNTKYLLYISSSIRPYNNILILIDWGYDEQEPLAPDCQTSAGLNSCVCYWISASSVQSG